MKTKILLISILAALALSFSASAQKFGADVLIHECSGQFWATPKISVAGNGWIYVLMNKYGHPTENDETRIYRSVDGGVTFQQLSHGITPAGFKQGGRDFVVTGNTASNIAVWYVFCDNEIAANKIIVRLGKMDADCNNYTSVFSDTYSGYINHDVSISTNARSPEGAYAPFAIAFAMSSNNAATGTGIIDYVYSLNGGATFSYKFLYSEPNSKFGSVDFSMGQALASNWWPIGSVVFEMDKDTNGFGNIGFQSFRADGNWLTGVIRVNEKIPSSVGKSMEPKIQRLCNNTIDAPDNFIIAYTRLWDGNDYDIVKIYPKPGYNTANHTLDILDWEYIAGSTNKDERYADLAYDKASNNYLLVYREREGNNEKLIYKVQHYTKIHEADWLNIGDVSTTSSSSVWNHYPVVDIDPTRTRACFAYYYYNSTAPATSRLLFDTEWSTLDVAETDMPDKDLKVYPNPATDIVTIALEQSGNYTVSLSDMQGREVRAVSFTDSSYQLNVADLPAGVYILKINGDNQQRYVQKLIKK